VRPIFERSCFRCHSAERPKSGFRLDNREAALKGGENGIDIIPGNSAKSPLIHYVARIAPDIEMPPEGKGEPLTAEQVGILRRWIEDGAAWDVTNAGAGLSFSLTPEIRWISISGDKKKFREIEGIREGAGGGLEEFSAQRDLGSDTTLRIEGRALVPDEDFKIRLDLTKTDVGFIRGGFEQWRRYYDDTGGYYPLFAQPSYDLNRDLHLDVGRAWIDFGLTLPDLPQIVVGYEYQFKEGAKSTLEWGGVGGKNIYPAYEDIRERVHIAKVDIEHEFLGWRIEDHARIEAYDLKTVHVDAYDLSVNSFVQTHESATHLQGQNALRLERDVADWWLISGGYLYSRLDGGASLDQMTVDTLGARTGGSFWSGDTTILTRESHIVSAATLVLPRDWLSLSAGAQSEWTRQKGFGTVNLEQGDPSNPNAFTLYPATLQSDLDDQKLSENVALRSSGIPYTILFAEGRFSQERIGQFEQDMADPGTTPRDSISFLRDTDYENDSREWRAGFNTSPWRWATLSAHYKRATSDSDYDTSKVSLRPDSYPGFIRARKIDGDEVHAKLALHPVSWARVALTYQIVSTDYHTTTEPVPGATAPSTLLAGDYDAHVYGVMATLTPFSRLYLSGTFTYNDSRIATLQTADGSVVPYKGKGCSVMASANYAASESMQINAVYSFSMADYAQDNVLAGLPLGLDYARHSLTVAMSRHLAHGVTARLGYGFFQYTENSSGGFNNYTAHGVFASINVKWP